MIVILRKNCQIYLSGGKIMNQEEKILDINIVDIEELPFVLSNQFDKLDELESNVQKAVEMAIEAKSKAENAQVKIGLFDFSKKDAINLLQSASEGLAEGIMTAAEAQKVSFEYQTKLTEITKFLFGLGLSNLAMNRSVVRELELKLKGASKEGISDLAKQELKNVIMQLKAQEDIMSKQAKLTDKVKQQNESIVSHFKKLSKHEECFEEQKKENAKFEKKIRYNEDKIKSLKTALKKQEDEFIEKSDLLDKKYLEVTGQLKDELVNLMNTFSENSETTKQNINLISERMNTQISLFKDKLSKVEVDLSNEIKSLETHLINTIDELKEEVSKKDKEAYNKLIDLQGRVNALDVITSKLGWKIGISIVAIGSLILNIIQICGII